MEWFLSPRVNEANLLSLMLTFLRMPGPTGFSHRVLWEYNDVLILMQKVLKLLPGYTVLPWTLEEHYYLQFPWGAGGHLANWRVIKSSKLCLETDNLSVLRKGSFPYIIGRNQSLSNLPSDHQHPWKVSEHDTIFTSQVQLYNWLINFIIQVNL